ncbi:MAG TPA: hypothetical protein DDY91_05880 [Planctomycetaceae bacterium]|nr:hypothetical protein [Planctomycetaceae bacterium]
MDSQYGQTLVTLAIVAGALAWWLHRAWSSWSGRPDDAGCGGGCQVCPQRNTTADPTGATGFVPLAALDLTARQPLPNQSPGHKVATRT